MSELRRTILAAILVALIAGTAGAQEQRPAASPPAQASPSPQPQPSQPQGSQPQMPIGLEQALYLIRSTLLTLNDANRTGNYTVLRDLAAPTFQAKNTAADLGAGFIDLRRRGIDLYPVALAAPQLSTAPYLDPNRMLRLTGLFPTRPLQINFDLTFQNVDNQWRLYGLSVATPQAAEPTPSPSPSSTATPAPAKKGPAPGKN